MTGPERSPSAVAKVRHEVEERGYVLLKTYRPNTSGEEIASALGKVLTLGEGSPVHQLRPTPKDQTTPNTYSGIYGLDVFPFHTDMAHWRHPPRYIMLRCLVGFEEVPTLLADGAEIVREADDNVLARALVQPRRPVKGRLPLLRIFQPSEGFGLIRWDDKFFRPASRAGEHGVERFRAALGTVSKHSIALVERGDTVVIDNWRMLHARSPVPPACEGRILERAYLEQLH
ncbi:TauD/TfdA family dioxygenase [Pelagibacterium limicola]|uniref:TauD/TfdA family dioxygenase n=1 Tax=Pelagibacterium limicola TaxID=2791022 RepID=UPI0018AFDFF1|nr:TauD/TfdA family dioxygenase [Pelagibacterium limicola]